MQSNTFPHFFALSPPLSLSLSFSFSLSLFLSPGEGGGRQLTPSEQTVLEMKRGGNGTGGGGSSLLEDGYNWKQNMEDPVNMPLGASTGREGRGGGRGGRGGGSGGRGRRGGDTKDHREDEEEHNRNVSPVSKSRRPVLPRCRDGSNVKIYIENQEVTWAKFNARSSYTNLRNFGMEDPNVGKIEWSNDISLLDAGSGSGELLDLSSIVQFCLDDDGSPDIKVYEQGQTPREGEGLNKPCIVTLYMPANDEITSEDTESLRDSVRDLPGASKFESLLYYHRGPENVDTHNVKFGRTDQTFPNSEREAYDALTISFDYFEEDRR
jgi:hypothetical protein